MLLNERDRKSGADGRSDGQNMKTDITSTDLSTGLTGILRSISFPPFSKTKWLRGVLVVDAVSAPISPLFGSESNGYGRDFFNTRQCIRRIWRFDEFVKPYLCLPFRLRRR